VTLEVDGPCGPDASTSIEQPKNERQDDGERHTPDDRYVPPEEELQNHEDEHKDRETAQRTAHDHLRSIDGTGPDSAYASHPPRFLSSAVAVTTLVPAHPHHQSRIHRIFLSSAAPILGAAEIWNRGVSGVAVSA
jgi:hypothetical protein